MVAEWVRGARFPSPARILKEREVILMICFRGSSCGRSVRTYSCVRRRPRPERSGTPPLLIIAILAVLLICAPFWCTCLLLGAALGILGYVIFRR